MTTEQQQHEAPAAQHIAGRELNALIAEKVMGWEWRRSRSTGRRCLYAPGRAPEHMQQMADGTEELVSDWYQRTWTPLYSTDIAAAWEVVERMRAMPGFSEYACMEALLGGDWRAVFMTEARHFEGEANSAPLAICLAALKAVAVAERSDAE